MRCDAVTVTLTVPPPAPTSQLGGVTEYEQATPPAWVTVTVWPAMVSVPVRGLLAGFSAIAKVTVPGPLPLLPAVMVSHAAPLLAVQAQPLGAVTVTLPVPAAAATARLVGATE
jgi:hypothetical protein